MWHAATIRLGNDNNIEFFLCCPPNRPWQVSPHGVNRKVKCKSTKSKRCCAGAMAGGKYRKLWNENLRLIPGGG